MNIEKPNLEILKPENIKLEEAPLDSTSQERVELGKKTFHERYKSANWWGWSEEHWSAYLGSLKKEDEISVEEKIVVNYGYWFLENADAEIEAKVNHLQSLELAAFLERFNSLKS